MKRYLILALLWYNATPVCSQSERIDSLTTLLTASSGDLRFQLLLDLAKANFQYNVPAALKFIDEAIENSSSDSAQIVKAYRIKAQLLHLDSKVNEAGLLIDKVLPYALRNNLNSEVESMYNLLGIQYNFQGRYSDAIRILYKCLTMKEISGDEEGKMAVYSNIGLIYYKLRNDRKALEYYSKAHALQKKFGMDETTCLINQGLCHLQLGDYVIGLATIKHALAQCSNCAIHKSAGYFALGLAFLKTNELDSSKYFFQKSLKLCREDGNYRFEAENLVYLSRVYKIAGYYDSALLTITRAESISNRHSLAEILLDVYRQSIELHKTTGDSKQILTYQDKFIRQKDDLYNYHLLRDLANTEAGFLEREHHEIIASQAQQLKVQELLMIYQRLITLCLLLVSCLIVVWLFLMFKRYTSIKNINYLLEKRVLERKRTLFEKEIETRRDLDNCRALIERCRLSVLRERQYLKSFESELDASEVLVVNELLLDIENSWSHKIDSNISEAKIR